MYWEKNKKIDSQLLTMTHFFCKVFLCGNEFKQ